MDWVEILQAEQRGRVLSATTSKVPFLAIKGCKKLPRSSGIKLTKATTIATTAKIPRKLRWSLSSLTLGEKIAAAAKPASSARIGPASLKRITGMTIMIAATNKIV